MNGSKRLEVVLIKTCDHTPDVYKNDTYFSLKEVEVNSSGKLIELVDSGQLAALIFAEPNLPRGWVSRIAKRLHQIVADLGPRPAKVQEPRTLIVVNSKQKSDLHLSLLTQCVETIAGSTSWKLFAHRSGYQLILHVDETSPLLAEKAHKGLSLLESGVDMIAVYAKEDPIPMIAKVNRRQALLGRQIRWFENESWRLFWWMVLAFFVFGFFQALGNAIFDLIAWLFTVATGD